MGKTRSDSTSTVSSGYTSFAAEAEADKLRKENEKLREELDRALSAGDASPVSTSPDSLPAPKEKKLKKEIAKLKEANAKILDMGEQQFSSLSDFERENAELRLEIETWQSNADGSPRDANSYSSSNSHGDVKRTLAKAEARLKAEMARAEEAVAREAKLRREIAEIRSRPQGNRRQSISEEETGHDKAIATLQYEIERLNKDLLVANKESRNTADFAAEYEELKQRAEEGRQKDLEIETLKMHVQTHFAELNQLRDQLREVEGGVTEDDLTFGMRSYQDDYTDDIAAAENEGLRSLNYELSKQLELYKNESDEAKKNLRDEVSRSGMEMKAFSMALNGVDDLRVAAEHMSRELNVIKKHGYVPSGGMTGEDVSQHVKNAIATQSINQTNTSNRDAATQPAQGFSLWNAMNAVMGPTAPQSMHAETETAGVAFGGSRNSIKVSSKHTSKRKKKKNQGGSIISSFF